jgi:hypothetical protein
MGELGVLLATGQGVPKDEAQARKLLTWKRRDQPLLLAGAMVSANDKSAPRGATTCFDWPNGRHGLLRERPGRAALLDVIEVSYSRLRLAECTARTSDPLALQGVNRTKGRGARRALRLLMGWIIGARKNASRPRGAVAAANLVRMAVGLGFASPMS